MRADCRVTERIDRGRWTGGTAQGYRTCMFKPTFLLPFIFLLGVGVGCKDDEPSGVEFGEACGDEVKCAEGLRCETGYCAETCESDSDCQGIEGFRHECFPNGLCRIWCEETTLACPSTLGTPMKCGVGFCEGAS